MGTEEVAFQSHLPRPCGFLAFIEKIFLDSKKSAKGDGVKKRLPGRKLDTRTPEEIKREQEILLWMGDIRDEFIKK